MTQRGPRRRDCRQHPYVDASIAAARSSVPHDGADDGSCMPASRRVSPMAFRVALRGRFGPGGRDRHRRRDPARAVLADLEPISHVLLVRGSARRVADTQAKFDELTFGAYSRGARRGRVLSDGGHEYGRRCQESGRRVPVSASARVERFPRARGDRDRRAAAARACASAGSRASSTECDSVRLASLFAMLDELGVVAAAARAAPPRSDPRRRSAGCSRPSPRRRARSASAASPANPCSANAG